MATTLKQIYDSRKEILEKKLLKADLMLQEDLKILSEKVDKSDVKRIGDVINQLEASVPDRLPALRTAIDKAKKELLGAFGGGILNQLTNFFKPEFAKPLTRAMAFLSGIKNAFSQLPTISAAAIPAGLKDKDLKISDVITDTNTENKFRSAFIEALKPVDIYAGILGMPYMSTADVKALGDEVLDLSVNEINQFSKSFTSKITLDSVSKADASELSKTTQTTGQPPEEPAAPTQPPAAVATTAGNKLKVRTKPDFIKAFTGLSDQDKLDPEKVYSAFLYQG